MVTATFLISAFSLILVGIFGLLTRKNIVRILLAVNIMETGVNLLLVGLGYFPGGRAPIITSSVSAGNLPFVDPLPQALVLTSIVIGLGTTALALAITLRYYRARRTIEFESDAEDNGALDQPLEVTEGAAAEQEPEPAGSKERAL